MEESPRNPLGTSMLGVVATALNLTYTPFVAMSLWNWFVTRALNASPLSFVQTLTLMWVLHLLVRTSSEMPIEVAVGRLETMVRQLVPDEKQNAHARALAEFDAMSVRAHGVGQVVGLLVRNTGYLLGGFALHQLTM